MSLILLIDTFRRFTDWHPELQEEVRRIIEAIMRPPEEETREEWTPTQKNNKRKREQLECTEHTARQEISNGFYEKLHRNCTCFGVLLVGIGMDPSAGCFCFCSSFSSTLPRLSDPSRTDRLVLETTKIG